MGLDEFTVMTDLCGKRVEHGVLTGGNTGVGAYFQKLRLHDFREIDPFYNSIHRFTSLGVLHITSECPGYPAISAEYTTRRYAVFLGNDRINFSVLSG